MLSSLKTGFLESIFIAVPRLILATFSWNCDFKTLELKILKKVNKQLNTIIKEIKPDCRKP